MPGYHAVAIKSGQVVYVFIEERSNRYGSFEFINERSRPGWMLNWKQEADIHFAESAKVSLVNAIHKAEEANNNAPAIAAGIARSASNPTGDVHAYNVLIDRDGGIQRIAVDVSNGEIIADPRALGDWP
jgi:hypothetical protein